MRLTVRPTKTFYVPEDSDGGFITIKALSLEEISAIESKCMVTSVDDTGQARITMDSHTRANNIAKACLQGWGGMLDVDGSELKFNQQNLKKAANYSIQTEDKLVRFFEWVDSCHNELIDEMEEQGEDAAKN